MTPRKIDPAGPVVVPLQSGDHAKQGGLAGPIVATDPQVFARLDRQFGHGTNDRVATGYNEIFDLDDGHEGN